MKHRRRTRGAASFDDWVPNATGSLHRASFPVYGFAIERVAYGSCGAIPHRLRTRAQDRVFEFS